jgi:hypothetical protein
MSNGTIDLALTTTDGRPQVAAAGWNYYGIASPITLNPNTWYNLAAVCDGTYVSMYLNGSYVGTDTHPGGPPSMGFGTLGFGRNLDTGTDWYLGSIDEVRLYNRAITSTEVAQVYSIPEPSSLTLFGFGLALLIAKRRK